MARKLFESQGIRKRSGGLATGVVFVVYSDEAGTALADISATVGAGATSSATVVAGTSQVTTANIAGLAPAALRFYGPDAGTDTLWVRVPSDTSLGVQKINAYTDARLDALEAGSASGIPGSIFDAKGDIIAASAADTAARLAVGANDTVLTADSTTGTGLKWGTGGGSVAAHEADTTAIHGIADSTKLALEPATADRVLYVSTAGNDANDGLSWGAAKLTIQAACDAINGPGRIYVGAGTYAEAISTDEVNIEIVGAGGLGQGTTLSFGGTRVLVGNGQWGFTFNPTAAATFFGGPVLRNIVFQGNHAAAAGGVRILRTNNYLLDHVGATDFAAGTGMLFDGTGNVNQYGTLIEPMIGYCLIGMDMVECSGQRVLGGMIDLGRNDPVNIIAGSIGIRTSGGHGTNKFIGTVIQCAETLAILGQPYEELIGCRFEVFDTTAVEVHGDYCQIYGGSINNFLGGSTGIGIDIKATADRTTVLPSFISAVSTPIVNAGSKTRLILPHFPKTARRTSGNLTLNSVTWADVDTGIDLSIPASIGDIVEVSMSAMFETFATFAGFLDVATVASGSPVTYFSSETGTPAGDGLPGWFLWPGIPHNRGVPVQLTLVPGDIVDGTVTLRLRYKTETAANRTLYANTGTPLTWSAKNLGPAT